MKTKINLNVPGSRSLRTTIPIALAEILGLKHGDTVKWSLETREKKYVLVFQKANDKMEKAK